MRLQGQTVRRGADLLAEIIAAKRVEVQDRRSRAPEAELSRAAGKRVPRGFRSQLKRPGRAIIAEMKKASPSRGLMRPDYRPAEIAAAYESAGARALSVLTDGPYFQGALEDIREARDACALPVLRKDFVIDSYQVVEAAAAGADCVLLIAAALGDEMLRSLLARASDCGLDALVEVHTEQEADRAFDAGATLIGINNRNLSTLMVDLETSLRVGVRLPAGVLKVSESGIRGAADLDRLEAAGFKAFLIGEHFMTADDPGAALRDFQQ